MAKFTYDYPRPAVTVEVKSGVGYFGFRSIDYQTLS